MREYELYHSGTRKNHKYIKKIGDRYFYTQQEIKAYLEGKKPKSDVTFEKDIYDGPEGKEKNYRVDFNKHDGGRGNGGWSDGVGLRVGDKKVTVYNTTNKKYFKDGERYTDQRRGRFSRSYAEDGSEYSVDLSDKKTHAKRAKAADDSYKDWYKFRKENGWVDQEESKSIEKEIAKREKQRKKSTKKKSLSKNAKKTMSSMKKKAAKGKKAVDKYYTKMTTPSVTVTYDEAKIK